MEAVVTLSEVRQVRTSRGNVRWVSRDTAGKEYVTFREAIGERARELAGTQVRIEYHEQSRGPYTNVYLDKIEPATEDGSAGDQAVADPDQAAWQSAVAAAPWLVGEPGATVPPKKLYDKLKPFEEYVADDIADHQARRDSGESAD